jgi:hypothetical protein
MGLVRVFQLKMSVPEIDGRIYFVSNVVEPRSKDEDLELTCSEGFRQLIQLGKLRSSLSILK